jgi:hypothetical protein
MTVPTHAEGHESAGPGGRSRSAAARVVFGCHGWLPTVLLAPFLLFPTVLPWATACGLVIQAAVLGWTVARRSSNGPGTPLWWPTITLLFMTIVGFAHSDDLRLALPKFAGVVLGVLVVRAIVVSARWRDAVWMLAALYVLCGTAFVAVGVLSGPQWKGKSSSASAVARVAPTVFGRLPDAAEAVNPNALAATTLFVLPLLALGWRTTQSPEDLELREDVSAPAGLRRVARLSYQVMRWAWLPAGLGVFVVWL